MIIDNKVVNYISNLKINLTFIFIKAFFQHLNDRFFVGISFFLFDNFYIFKL